MYSSDHYEDLTVNSSSFGVLIQKKTKGTKGKCEKPAHDELKCLSHHKAYFWITNFWVRNRETLPLMNSLAMFSSVFLDYFLNRDGRNVEDKEREGRKGLKKQTNKNNNAYVSLWGIVEGQAQKEPQGPRKHIWGLQMDLRGSVTHTGTGLWKSGQRCGRIGLVPPKASPKGSSKKPSFLFKVPFGGHSC